MAYFNTSFFRRPLESQGHQFNFNFPGSSPPFHPDILYTEGIGRLKRTH